MHHLVLEQPSQNGDGAVDGVNVAGREAAAHVSSSGHRHPLDARLEEVQIRQHSQKGSVSQAGLCVLRGQLLQCLQTCI